MEKLLDYEDLQNLKMKLFRKFNNNELANIAEAITDRMNEQTIDEIWQCLDDELIWADDQWTVLKYYFSIGELTADSYSQALEQFVDDIASVLDIYE